MRYGGPGRVLVAGVAAVGLLVGGCGDGGSEPGPDPTTPATPSGEASPTAAPEPAPGRHELRLAWNGSQRRVLLDAPASYRPDRPTPLVVVLHGGPGTPETVQSQSGMTAAAEEHGFLVAYPAGHLRRWRTNPGVPDEADDVGYLTALVDRLVADWNVAPDQVYAAGFSNGASMVYRLAIQAADVFAAVAPVSGNLTSRRALVAPSEPVSVVGLVGLNDAAVVDTASLDVWRNQLDCPPGEPVPVGAEDRVVRIDATCQDGSEVTEYRLANTGHVWPQAGPHGLDGTAAIWEFFAAHARSG